MGRPALVGISGSLRQRSHNTAILATLAEQIAPQATMTLFSLADVPLYNQDLDTEPPPFGVIALRDAVATADGVVLATPEYNHGMSGVLKNALDWASRPFGRAPLVDKPVMTLSSAPGALGGVRAHAQLNETLLAIPCRPIVYPQAVVTQVARKIVDGRLVDQETLTFLMANIAKLLTVIAGED